jgi:hypothetical protein
VRKLISKNDDDDDKTRLSSEAQFLLARATVGGPLFKSRQLPSTQQTAGPLRCSAHVRFVVPCAVCRVPAAVLSIFGFWLCDETTGCSALRVSEPRACDAATLAGAVSRAFGAAK